MNISIIGVQKNELAEYITEHFPQFVLNEQHPELIITYGGDGTLLYAERLHPGIPKVMIRNSQVCVECSKNTKHTILELLQKKQYRITQQSKVEAQANGKTLTGLNDVVVAHSRMTHALRAQVSINDSQYTDLFLGDGIVVSTPLGSTGYYQSITRSNFQFGMGVAFNNSVNILSHLVLDQESRIDIEVTRGPGIVVADNSDEEILLETGDRVHIQKSQEVAHLVEFDAEHRRFNSNPGTRVPVGFCQICHKHYGASS